MDIWYLHNALFLCQKKRKTILSSEIPVLTLTDWTTPAGRGALRRRPRIRLFDLLPSVCTMAGIHLLRWRDYNLQCRLGWYPPAVQPEQPHPGPTDSPASLPALLRPPVHYSSPSSFRQIGWLVCGKCLIYFIQLDPCSHIQITEL